MTLNLIDMTADLAFMIADLSATMIWKSGTYSVAADGRGESVSLTIEGEYPDDAQIIYALCSDFTGAVYPAPDDIVKLNGHSLRVSKVTPSPDSVELRLDCVEVTG